MEEAWEEWAALTEEETSQPCLKSSKANPNTKTLITPPANRASKSTKQCLRLMFNVYFREYYP